MNKNIQDKTHRLPTPSKNTPTPYQCGCGVQFHAKSDFKEHSIRLHDAQHIAHSTHFLTPFTLIVLPAHQHQESEQEPLPQQPALHLTKEKTSHMDEVTAIQSSRVDNTHLPTSNRRKSAKDNPKYEKIVQRNPKEQEENEIEWNGFRLCRNTKVESGHLFCGKCMLTFLLPDQFIVHCLQVCQRLKYGKSSHFILCDIPQERTQQIQRKVIQPSQGKKQAKKQQTQEIFIHKTIKDLIGNQMTDLFMKYYANMEGNFFCGGCNKTLRTSYAYNIHIRKFHSQIVPPKSSHVILRSPRSINKYVEIYYYIPVDNTEQEDEQDYYCCCNPEAMMTLKKLIRHTIEVHKGISPLYGREVISQPTQLLRPLRTTTMQAQLAPTEITQTVDPIFSINSNMEHKKPPFRCHSCDIQFDSPSGYIFHFQSQIDKGHQHLGSHIVLRLENQRRKKRWPVLCLHITAQEAWSIKEPIYYCPCTPERVTMKELIEHVSIAHSCISPIYKKPLQ